MTNPSQNNLQRARFMHSPVFPVIEKDLLTAFRSEERLRPPNSIWCFVQLLSPSVTFLIIEGSVD